jgi:hypothetical protein
VLRGFRLMRVFKLARSWRDLNRILNTIGRSVASVGYLSLLLLLVVFVFALMGTQLFGYKLRFCSADGAAPLCPPGMDAAADCPAHPDCYVPCDAARAGSWIPAPGARRVRRRWGRVGGTAGLAWQDRVARAWGPTRGHPLQWLGGRGSSVSGQPSLAPVLSPPALLQCARPLPPLLAPLAAPGSPYNGLAFCERFPRDPAGNGTSAAAPVASNSSSGGGASGGGPGAYEYWAQVGAAEVPRSNFDNIGWALLAVFQCLTIENWNDIAVRAGRWSRIGGAGCWGPLLLCRLGPGSCVWLYAPKDLPAFLGRSPLDGPCSCHTRGPAPRHSSRPPPRSHRSTAQWRPSRPPPPCSSCWSYLSALT